MVSCRLSLKPMDINHHFQAPIPSLNLTEPSSHHGSEVRTIIGNCPFIHDNNPDLPISNLRFP